MKKYKISKDIWIFLLAVCVSFGFIASNYTYKKNIEEAKAKAKIERSKEEAKKAEEEKIEPIPSDISDPEVLSYLEEFQKRAKDDKRYNEVIKNSKEYQKDVLELLYKNDETLDFVLSKSNFRMPGIFVKIDKECGNGVIPILQQWDPKWGWYKYGENILALNGCGPTSLAMVITGLTGNDGINPMEIAKYSDENGYHEKAGTNWDLMTDIVEKYGVKGRRISVAKESFENALNSGNPIICSVGPGYFTKEGHFIVISGIKDGKLIIHDPNSIKNSKKLWEFNDIKNQIKAAWAYSLE
ncbi:C39 family peptidase [Peptacetobacter sp.]|uniref:C39 family peptidase n=1 Tax=Peptacetobacter sp. TaxID=2991975 RepID=UPI00263235B2|nr:C39 family peptidase [Peptacetobacter sp.]MEE0452455.1 C39 family peptidase [Peptacetobacter sp.]